MATDVMGLRRERGFRNAREFARALGISPSSLSRYDRDPTPMPLRVAWAMADELGCSIDEAVGRVPVRVGTGEVQAAYDALSAEGRALVDDLLEFAAERDARTRERAAADAGLRFERAMRLHERMFHESLCEGRSIADVVAFASAAEEREAFRRWLVARAASQRAEATGGDAPGAGPEARDAEAVEQIMAAYDRAHGTRPAAGAGVDVEFGAR